MSGECHLCGHALCVCNGESYEGWTCERCGNALHVGEWPFCPHGFPLNGLSVIDDELEGGPRVFETMGHEGVYIASKSQWKREVIQRGLVNVDKHDSAYYAKQRRMHDEHIKDTGYTPDGVRVR